MLASLKTEPINQPSHQTFLKYLFYAVAESVFHGSLQQLFDSIFFQYFNIWCCCFQKDLIYLISWPDTTYTEGVASLSRNTHPHHYHYHRHLLAGSNGWDWSLLSAALRLHFFTYLWGVDLHSTLGVESSWSLPNDKTRHVKRVCLWDDVAALESGLAGFLREGRKQRQAHAKTERTGANYNKFFPFSLSFTRICLDILGTSWCFSFWFGTR